MFTKSIRWRLQVWQAFLLLCTLSGFGIASFEVYRTKQYQEVDEQLGHRVEGLGRFARGPFFLHLLPDRRDRQSGEPPARFDDFPRHEPPPRDSEERGRSGPPPEFKAFPPSGISEARLPPGFEKALQEDQESGIYFVIWNADGARLKSSTNTPPDLPRPAETDPDTGPRFYTRNTYREAFEFNREGRCVLVGRSIVRELEAMRSFAFLLTGAGAAVLALGLGGGWLIASRVMRPLQNISSTATRISAGNLSERISVEETENELGRLAQVLNSTFARLETAFAQQKQFTADASHELRTPLAVIISEAQTTLARERNATEYRETVQACLDTAQQMRRLTESLLELARFDAGQQQIDRRPLDIAETVRVAVEQIRPLASESAIQIHCDLNPAVSLADSNRLSQVVMNLLSNAIRYNKPNGEIRVSTRSENGAAILTVSDTGTGISPEDLPHIFERFYRGDKARGSDGRTGLGLAISKAIVEAHGGSIEVSSQNGSGATFTVRLPGSREAAIDRVAFCS